MKRLFLVFLMLSSMLARGNETKEVIIAADNWCPINCGQDEENKGFMIDVATEALKEEGYKVKYIELPWLRAIQLAREGKIHGIVGAFKDEAPDFYYPNVPFLHMSPNSIFTLEESEWHYETIRSFNSIRLGVIKGYDYGQLLNTYIKSHSESEDSSVFQLSGDDAVQRSLKFLLKKRIDVYVDAGPVFWYHANQLGITDQVKTVGSISPKEPCYIAFSPKLEISNQLSLALDKGVISLKQRGEISQIAKRYGLKKAHYR